MNGAGPSSMVVEKDVVGPSAMVVESDSVGPSPMVTVVSRSHTLSKTGERLVCLASSTCALLPKSGKSNQIAGKPIITFRPYVTSRIRSRTLVLA